jgi:hypothetical protein
LNLEYNFLQEKVVEATKQKAKKREKKPKPEEREGNLITTILISTATCGWRSAVFGRELLEIALGMWFG